MAKLLTFLVNFCGFTHLLRKFLDMDLDKKYYKPAKAWLIFKKIAPVGNYAIQLYFSDGHNTGLYSWDLLYRFGVNYESMWQRYLERMQQAGENREPTHVIAPKSPSTTCTSCQ